MKAHNYEVDEKVQKYTRYGNLLVREKTYPKKVVMTNVEECKDRITAFHVRIKLIDMGWAEWEDLMANELVKIIVDAINNGEKEADITKLFACELFGEDQLGAFGKSQESVVDFLFGRLFEVLDEDNEVMHVRIIESAIA